jgi:hypothetical protein
MGRIKLVLAVAGVMLAMVVASIPPALAVSPEDSIVFFPVPLGNGATYSCTGGPPFVSDGDDSTRGNCSVEQIGPPADLICDVPITITFVHDMHQFVADASICHSS